MTRYLLLIISIVVFNHQTNAQKELDLVGEDGSKHKLQLNWDDPDFAPKWRVMLIAPGFLIGDAGALSNRFEVLVKPIDKLDIQGRLTIPYAKKVDFGRETPVGLEDQTVSTLQYTLKAGYSLFSGETEKLRKTQVGGKGNIAYVAEIPRTIRNSLQVVAGYDFYRAPASFQVGLESASTSNFSGSDDYYCMNSTSSNILGGLALSREQSYGVTLDDETFAFGGTLKAYFLVAANLNHSSDIYVKKTRLDYNSQIETTTVELSDNDSINSLVTLQERMGIRMGVDYFISRPNAVLMNTFSFGFEIGTLPYYQLNDNIGMNKGYASVHFGYGFGQRLNKNSAPKGAIPGPGK